MRPRRAAMPIWLVAGRSAAPIGTRPAAPAVDGGRHSVSLFWPRGNLPTARWRKPSRHQVAGGAVLIGVTLGEVARVLRSPAQGLDGGHFPAPGGGCRAS